MSDELHSAVDNETKKASNNATAHSIVQYEVHNETAYDPTNQFMEAASC